MTAETNLPAASLPLLQGPAVPVPTRGAAPLGGPVFTPVPVAPPAAGQLTVEAGEYAGRTVLTLTNSGGTTLQWHAVVDADWLRLSRDSGTLEPGQRITVTVTVDDQKVPQDHWTARIALPPSEAVVTLEGGPTRRGGGTPSPSPSGSGSASPTPPVSPSSSPSTSASASAGPSASPTPSPTPSGSPVPSASPTPSPAPTVSPTAAATR